MKKLLFCMMAIAMPIISMGLVACGDDDPDDTVVPTPNPDGKNNPDSGGGSTTGGGGDSSNSSAIGDGTRSNPYNVAAIIAIAEGLNEGAIDATDYYFKGTVSEVEQAFDLKNTLATFYINDGPGTSQFLCNKVRFLCNEEWWGCNTNVTVGDEVVVCGKITNGGTSEERAYTYALNGITSLSAGTIEYSVNGRKFQTVLVEGGPMEPFYIMQTEVPLNQDVIMGNRVIAPPDLNYDGIILQTEYRAYLEDLRKATNIRFRLPTKEEWQYAARGGNKRHGYTYSGSNTVDDVAWYSGNSDKKAHDIALKNPNELGLYDMSGNYAEVCAGSDDQWRINGVLCGGSWKNTASGCQATSWVSRTDYSKLPEDATIRLVYSKN